MENTKAESVKGELNLKLGDFPFPSLICAFLISFAIAVSSQVFNNLSVFKTLSKGFLYGVPGTFVAWLGLCFLTNIYETGKTKRNNVVALIAIVALCLWNVVPHLQTHQFASVDELWQSCRASQHREKDIITFERTFSRCTDGRITSSVGRGTCSWHGGVESVEEKEFQRRINVTKDNSREYCRSYITQTSWLHAHENVVQPNDWD